MVDVGYFAVNATTVVNTCSLYGVGIRCVDGLIYNPTDGPILRSQPGGGPYAKYEVTLPPPIGGGGGAPGPSVETEYSGPTLPMYFYSAMDQDYPATSLPAVVTISFSFGYRLWRSHNMTGKQRYWSDCHVVDGWRRDPTQWSEVVFSGPCGSGTARWRDTSVEDGAAVGSINFDCTFYGGVTGDYLFTFAAQNGTYAKVEAAVGSGGIDFSGSGQDYGNGWALVADAGSLEMVYSNAPTQAYMPTEVVMVGMPATIVPALNAYEIGGGTPNERTDVVVTMPPSGDPVTGAISSLPTFTVGGGTPITATVDETWAKANDEYAGLATDDPSPGMPYAADNLSIKLDVPPPQLGVGADPYWTGPAYVEPYDWLDLFTLERIVAAVGDVPADDPVSTDTVVPVEDAWLATSRRWTASGGEVVTNDSERTLTLTVAGAGAVSATHANFSYWPDRQTGLGVDGKLACPECYRITRANYHWPTEPGLAGETVPEDIYDWTALRYLAIKATASRYPVRLRLTMLWSTPTPSDNHLTGSTRSEEYTCSYITGTHTATATLDAAGWVLFDLWAAKPGPRIVTSYTVTAYDLQAGDTLTVERLGLTRDMPARNRVGDLPGTNGIVKWLDDWTQVERTLSARSNGLPSLDVLDRYRQRNERTEAPAVEWLFGAESGLDLSSPLTLEATLGIVGYQEGWHIAWDQASWDAQAAYINGDGDTVRLEPGYPWDVRWEAPVTTDGGLEPQCCIGARSWQVASGLEYTIKGRWMCRGRLDGIYSGAGGALRSAMGVYVNGDGVDETVDSDPDGNWWSPSGPEAEGDDGTAFSYSVGDPAQKTSPMGCGEWIYLGPINAEGRSDLRYSRWGGVVMVRPGHMPWPGQLPTDDVLVLDIPTRHGGAPRAQYTTALPIMACASIDCASDGSNWVAGHTHPEGGAVYLIRCGPMGLGAETVASINGYSYPTVRCDCVGRPWVLARRDADGQACVLRLKRADGGDSIEELTALQGMAEEPGGLEFMPDGSGMAVVPNEGSLMMWVGANCGRDWSASP